MSSVLGVSSVATATNPYLPNVATAMQSNFGQSIQDFQSVAAALQSGNLTTAQTAMAAFQNDLTVGLQGGASQPFGANVQANTDFQTLTNSLKNGNLAGAQTAFASLQTDLNINLSGAAGTTSTGSSFSSIFTNLLSGLGLTF